MDTGLAYRWQTFNPMYRDAPDRGEGVTGFPVYYQSVGPEKAPVLNVERSTEVKQEGLGAKLNGYKEGVRQWGRDKLPEFAAENADTLAVAGQLIGHSLGGLSGYLMKNPFRFTVASSAVPITFLSMAGTQKEETPEEKERIDNMGVIKYAGHRIGQSLDFLSPNHFLRSYHRRELLGLINIGIGIGVYLAGTRVKHNKSFPEALGSTLNFASGGTLLFGRDDDKSWQWYGAISTLNAPMQLWKTQDMWMKYKDYSYVAMSASYILGNALAFFVGDNAKELPDGEDIPRAGEAGHRKPEPGMTQPESGGPTKEILVSGMSRSRHQKQAVCDERDMDAVCSVHL